MVECDSNPDSFPAMRGPVRRKSGCRFVHADSSCARFLAHGLAEEPEFGVEKDPRTGETLFNPAKILDIVETTVSPSHPIATIEFEGRQFSIGTRQNREERANHRDLEAFRILYQFSQLTVTDVSKVPTLPITIAK